MARYELVVYFKWLDFGFLGQMRERAMTGFGNARPPHPSVPGARARPRPHRPATHPLHCIQPAQRSPSS